MTFLEYQRWLDMNPTNNIQTLNAIPRALVLLTEETVTHQELIYNALAGYYFKHAFTAVMG